MAEQKKNKIAAAAEYALAVALMGVLRALPLGMANSLAAGATRWLDRLMPRLRRTALENLSFAYPDLTKAQLREMADGVFRSVARMLVTLARFPDMNHGNIHGWIYYEGLENYLAAKAKGKGILVATAHLGNWELSAFAHALMTEPMSVMVRPLDNPYIDKLVEKRRVLSGNRLIEKKDAARAVLKALRDNEAVGVLIDQNTSAAEGIFIPFFGRLACASPAFVKLAQHSGAAVIPGYAVWERENNRYRLIFEPEIPMTGDVEEDLRAVHNAVEKAIRQNPDQWLWIHRRWKTRPVGKQAAASSSFKP